MSFSLIAGLCVLLLILTGQGCAPSGPKPDFVIINGKEPETLDPGLVVGQPDGRAAGCLFEGLMRYNTVDASPEPAIAERWDVSPDLKSYTFHLRPSALWSNGEPITARDFAYSWLRVLKPDTGAEYAGNLYYIKNAEAYNTGKLTDASQVGIHALDARTLRVDLENPTPFFLNLLCFYTYAVVPGSFVEKFGDRWLKQPGFPTSGAYTLVDWRLEDRIRIRRNPLYWDAANTRNELVDLIPVSLPSTALNLYLTGLADVIWDKDTIPTDLLDALRSRADFHVYDYLATYFMRFNLTRKPFNDPRIRRALAMSIDRRRITDRVTKGGERPASFLVPTGIANYTSPKGLPYDPEAARKLLAEAGFPKGEGFPRFSYLFNTSRDHERIAVELQEMWRKELGIVMELRPMEWKTYLRAQASLDFDLSRSSWVGDYPDPNTFLDTFTSGNPNNRTGWKNSTYDSLINRANATIDPVARMALLAEAESLLISSDAALMPIYIYVGFNFFDPASIAGIHNNLLDEHPVRTIRRIAPRKLH